MIRTENLTKRFTETLAVDGLSLDIREGEVFGFLGPNGAGKTTTVRVLTSLIGPTSGAATVAGFPIGQRDTDIRRNVGVLTETPGMYDNLSAEYNLRISRTCTRSATRPGRWKSISRCWVSMTAASTPPGPFPKG